MLDPEVGLELLYLPHPVLERQPVERGPVERIRPGADYPEVFRQVLRRILIEDEHTDPDCDDDWPSLWLKLARQLPGMDEPPASTDDQEIWIDRATEAFSAQSDVLAKLNQALQEAQ